MYFGWHDWIYVLFRFVCCCCCFQFAQSYSGSTQKPQKQLVVVYGICLLCLNFPNWKKGELATHSHSSSFVSKKCAWEGDLQWNTETRGLFRALTFFMFTFTWFWECSHWIILNFRKKLNSYILIGIGCKQMSLICLIFMQRTQIEIHLIIREK